MPLLSFLLPTRKRTAGLYRFLQSVADTTDRIDEVEIVLCVDEDDPQSHNITFEPLSIKTAIVPAGATLGELLRNCFSISTGRFVMFMNDDVLVRTKFWDRGVYSAFASFADDIGLVYVNDLLFREKLSIFPILSRKACLEIGVCPAAYRRYRIDNHIYDTYNILALLGHRRIVYLPDVIFEHLNKQTVSDAKGKKFVLGERFESDDGKVYIPNPEILKFDAPLFGSLRETRKQDALKLAMLIERPMTGKKRKRLDFKERLKNVKDEFGYRHPDFVRVMPLSTLLETTENATVNNQPALQEESWEISRFAMELRELESICARLPLFQTQLVREVTSCLVRSRERGDKLKTKFCEDLIFRIKGVFVTSSAPVPVLLESYKGYNLVHYLDNILVVPNSLGPLNLATQQDRERPEIRSATSLEAAKFLIDGMIGHSGQAGSGTESPILLQTYQDHNLVSFNGEIYAVPLSLGPIDLTEENIRSKPEILTADSIEGTIMMVERVQKLQHQQILVSEKQAKIEELYRSIAEREAVTVELQQALQAREALLSEKQAKIEELYRSIAEREAVTAELEQALQAREALLSEKQSKIEEQEAEIKLLKIEIEKTQIALELSHLR